MKTYPEMDKEIVKLLDMEGMPLSVYAARYIEKLQAENSRLTAENAELRARLDRAVELPVKMGGDVYSVRWSKDNPKDGIVMEEYVSRIEVDSSSGFAIHTIKYEPLLSSGIYYNVDWNDTVFATRAEAEARLKEIQEKNND